MKPTAILTAALLCVLSSHSFAKPIEEIPKMPVVKPLFDYPVRDTSVCLGPDGMYYLTGTTGHPTWWHTNEGIRMWKLRDLKTWEPLGLVWSFEKNATWQKGQLDKDGKIEKRAIWAPELHYFKGTYWLAYCLNYDKGGTGILKSESGKPEGPYVDVKKDGPMTGEIDASLFADDDGTKWWSTYFGNDDKAPFKERPAILRVEIGSDNIIKPIQ